jgi:cytochrome P450
MTGIDLQHDIQRDPYAGYQALREQGALHWSEEFCGGAWLLTDYADVAAVLRDPRFSVQRTGRWINSSLGQDGKAARDELREFKRIFSRSLLFIDGARHTRLRQAMNAGFKPAAMQARAPRIQQIVDGLLDAIMDDATSGDGGFDFMRDFARPLPALVIADMMGVDAGDRADFVAWSDDIAVFIGSPTPTLEQALTAQTALLAMRDYFQQLLPQRRAQPGDDLVSLLICAEQDGGITTNIELIAQCCTLLFAGHETTRNLLGNGLLALLRHPEQWRKLQDEPAKLPAALRELLRYDSPVQYTGRRLTEDVVMHGQQLKKGQLVIPLIGAANRDPNRFTRPDELDITRDEGNHLSFGYGAHVCIGATLTYLEAEIAFRTLMRRLPSLQADGAHIWQDNSVYRGLAAFPVRTGVEEAVHA